MFGKWKKKSAELEGQLQDANKAIEQLGMKLADCQQQRESLSEELAISVSQMADLRQQYSKVCVSLGDMRKKYQKTIDIEEFNKLLLNRRSELEKRAEEAQFRLNGQEAEIEKNLAVLSVLDAQAFAKVDLELDLKLVLRECEERLMQVEMQAKETARKEYAEVEYCFSMNGSRAQGARLLDSSQRIGCGAGSGDAHHHILAARWGFEAGQVRCCLQGIILRILPAGAERLVPAGHDAYHLFRRDAESGGALGRIQHAEPPAGACPCIDEPASH